tara:strand:- start:1774 stop:2016 length:243 start_codon:yes stop_codon:yes gene_type:complete
MRLKISLAGTIQSAEHKTFDQIVPFLPVIHDFFKSANKAHPNRDTPSLPEEDPGSSGAGKSDFIQFIPQVTAEPGCEAML